MRNSWNRTAVLLAAAAVPVLVLAGCSESTAGSATGVATSAPQKSSGTAAPSSSAAVSRPRTFDMAAVTDPCLLVPEAIRTRFGLGGDGIPGESSVFPGSKTCGFSSHEGDWSIRVGAVPDGTGDFYRETGEVEEVRVADFPAVVAPDTRVVDTCYLGVDVDDGQLLDLISSSRKGVPMDELCARAKTVAEAAVGVLAGG
ncbi:DUF3558 domain-containing protein [Umezawaea beigongshangensis]|uniref:DUF3558 domain-containing protein n=1 Tax=Umezawaea beigongshangensis TaxID=2780383 RepID=UPI0018F1ADFE|nr:DUF3558 domain-containing protein [Umezawaea beigongshangensis]